MNVSRVLMSEVSAELTAEEMQEIEALNESPIIFDEDCPEMTDEMLKQFHRFHTVPINVSALKIKCQK